MITSTILSICLAIVLWSSDTSANNITTPVAAPFYSRTDIVSIALNVTLNDASKVAPGYIFLAPYQIDQPGPYIFDTSGNLLWAGFGVAGPGQVHGFHVCSYGGSDHLCFFQGTQELGYARGHGLIIDNTFRAVTSVQSGNGMPPSDQHEFKVINGGKTALITVFDPVAYDLSDYKVTGAQGYIMQGVCQEIDVDSGDVVFEWKSLDHVDPSAGFVLPNTTDVSGSGSMASPWDYFHINSIDKLNGNYLISSRHTETIFKVAPNGSVIWKLGGKDSDFKMPGFNFSYQHDARFVSENSTMTVISFYDNAHNGFNSSANYSTGKIVALNDSTMTATLVQEYNAQQVSDSQGNLQLLEGGNIFMGHGSSQYISEMTENGTLIYSAHFATEGSLQYRSYKFNFTTNPKSAPSVYAYAHNETAPPALYMSWNGATEVRSWRMYSGSSPSSLTYAGNSTWGGFETVVTLPTFAPYVIAEAVAGNGTGLRNSSLTSTFVPGSSLAQSCNEIQCPLSGATTSDTSASSTRSDAAASETASSGEGMLRVPLWWTLGTVAGALGWTLT